MRFRDASFAAALGLLCMSGAFAQAEPDKRRSGFDTMSARIQTMQRDDLQNPGMLWVADGEVLWNKVFGISFSCAHCHNDAKQSMKGVAARYPDWDPIEKRPVNLSQRINLCRTRHQLVLPLPPESVELLGLEAYVAHQSRGMPLAPSTAKRAGRAARARTPAVRATHRSAQPVVRAVPRRTRRQKPGRQHHSRRPRQWLPHLPPGVARPRFVAAPAAQLPERRTRRAAAVQFGRDGGARALPGAAQRRHEDRNPGRQTLSGAGS